MQVVISAVFGTSDYTVPDEIDPDVPYETSYGEPEGTVRVGVSKSQSQSIAMSPKSGGTATKGWQLQKAPGHTYSVSASTSVVVYV